MADPKLIETRDVALADIKVDLGDRLRPASDHAVAAVMASVEELGHALTPIMLRRKGSGAKARLVLIGGLHRFEAYRRLGRETIRADIWTCTDDWARLAQIDENLAGADLDTLELATFLADRKRVYERLHPSAKHGGDRRSEDFADQTETISFCSSIAEKRDMSDRHVRNLVRIGENLDVEAKVLLRKLEKPLGYNDLAALTECGRMQQADVVRLMLGEDKPRLKDAIRAAKGEVAPPPPNKDEATFRDLLERFERASKVARRRFVNELIVRNQDLVYEEWTKVTDSAGGDA